MNIFKQEFKSNLRSTLTWTIALSVLAIAFLTMFTAFTKDVDAAKAIIGNLPLAVRNALDISLGNFFTIYGFFGYLFNFIALAGAVQAMNLGVSMLSKEDSGKTADFLLTKPISRQTVVTSKLFASVLLIVITNAVFTLSAIVTARSVSVDAFDYKLFLMISATLLFTQLIFLALGFLMSVIVPKIKSAVSVTLPTVFAFFIAGMLGAIIGNDNVRYITPFKFFEANYIITNSTYELTFLVIGGIFSAVAILATYVIYLRKDIKAAS